MFLPHDDEEDDEAQRKTKSPDLKTRNSRNDNGSEEERSIQREQGQRRTKSPDSTRRNQNNSSNYNRNGNGMENNNRNDNQIENNHRNDEMRSENQSRPQYYAKRQREPQQQQQLLPDHLILLHTPNKACENKIANMFKDCGWMIYDHLYPFRMAAKAISHDINYREDFVNFLATQTCSNFHHPKDEFVFYSFLKWCRHLTPRSRSVIVLGVFNDEDVQKFRANGACVVSSVADALSDYLILSVEMRRIEEISQLVIQSHPFILHPAYHAKFDSIQKKQIQYYQV